MMKTLKLLCLLPSLVLLATPLMADPFAVTIQPIHVRDDGGFPPLAGLGVFSSEGVNAFWNQAGIEIVFLPTVNFDNSAWLDVSTDPLNTTQNRVIDLFTQPGHMQNSDPLVLNLWFVNEIEMGLISGTSLQGGNGMVVRGGITIEQSDRVIAHILGHNLGLTHVADSTNLMALPPGNLLNHNQIDIAQSSEFAIDVAVPEPTSFLLMGTGLGALGLIGYRRRKK